MSKINKLKFKIVKEIYTQWVIWLKNVLERITKVALISFFKLIIIKLVRFWKVVLGVGLSLVLKIGRKKVVV